MHVVFLNILTINITFMVYNIYFALITEVNPWDFFNAIEEVSYFITLIKSQLLIVVTGH